MCVIVIITVFKYFSVSQDVSYHTPPPPPPPPCSVFLDICLFYDNLSKMKCKL